MSGETIKLNMPTSCTVLVYPSQEHPGEWIIKCGVEALDVETGEPDHFSTTWQGVGQSGPPSRETIAQTVIDMFAHEIREQLGLDPHHTRAA